MKKQTTQPDQAHLLQAVFYLLLPLAVCAIPFALAQRNPVTRGLAKPYPVIVKVQQGAQDQSQFPAVVLYDQLNNSGTTGAVAQDFEASLNAYDSFAADDFVVPTGQKWNITQVDARGYYSWLHGPAESFNIFIYKDSGSLPGANVYTAIGQSYANNSGVFKIILGSPAVLGAGTYWVSVQARMDFITNGLWYWTNRTVQANSPAAWQNPGGGYPPPQICPAFGCPTPCPTCPTWGIRQCCASTVAGQPDQMFRLIGTTQGATPTPTLL